MGRFRYLWTILVILGALFMTEVAFCKVKIELHLIPPGIKYKLPDKTEVRYYRLSDYLKLVDVDNDLWIAKQQLKEYKLLTGKFSLTIDSKDRIIESYKADNKIYMDRSDRLSDRWGKCEESLRKSKFSLTSFLAGLGIGGAATAVVITVLVISLK